jgi:restriction system protein
MFSLFSAFKQLFADKTPTPTAPKPQRQAEDAKTRYLQNTLAFAKEHHRTLSKKQREQEQWQRRYGMKQAAELRQLSGTEFEQYLTGLFHQHGYQVELTPASGDYGADLLLSKQGQRIAVQAKCYTGSVGVSAVQEALSGMAYYQCHGAWVITTGTYTTNAVELARKSNVRLLDSTELGKLMMQVADNAGSSHG